MGCGAGFLSSQEVSISYNTPLPYSLLFFVLVTVMFADLVGMKKRSRRERREEKEEEKKSNRRGANRIEMVHRHMHFIIT